MHSSPGFLWFDEEKSYKSYFMFFGYSKVALLTY